MNASLNWLSALLGTELEPTDVAHKLAMLGAPVESIEPLHQDLGDIIVAEVERVERHPNADRLTLCYVNNGVEVVEVVCGAPNVGAGKRYPYAAVGTVLPGGLKLKGRKIRGVQSNGMLCSASELELGADQDGIMELDTDAPAGTHDLEEAGAVAGCATAAPAHLALDVDFGRRFREREEGRPESHLGVRREEMFGEVVQCGFEFDESNAFVYCQALDL